VLVNVAKVGAVEMRAPLVLRDVKRLQCALQRRAEGGDGLERRVDAG
jgi:hypothetical protein